MRTFLLVAIAVCLLVPGLVFAESNEGAKLKAKWQELKQYEKQLKHKAQELEKKWAYIEEAREELEEDDDDDDHDVWDELEIRERELDLEARDMELDFERQHRELELHKMRSQMEGHNRAQMNKKSAHGMGRHHGGKKGCGVFILIAIVVHVLLAVWTYKDIREKTNSSGIWIVVVLLTGLLGAIVYAIVRLGDLKQKQNV
jgi:hypothetical protein